MNRAELTTTIAQRSGVDPEAVDRVLDGLDAVLVELAGAQDELKWTGLLSMDVVQRKGRTGRNPQTGAELEIPPGAQIRFRPGVRLKRAAQGG